MPQPDSSTHARTRSAAAPRLADDESLSPRQRDHLRQLSRIKRETLDGATVSGADARFLYAVLSNHPRAKAKIGPGIRAFTVHTFISGTRCFFAIRTDGSITDFSAPNCVTGRWPKRSPIVQRLMERFPYRNVIRQWLAGLGASGRAGAA